MCLIWIEIQENGRHERRLLMQTTRGPTCYCNNNKVTWKQQRQERKHCEIQIWSRWRKLQYVDVQYNRRGAQQMELKGHPLFKSLQRKEWHLQWRRPKKIENNKLPKDLQLFNRWIERISSREMLLRTHTPKCLLYDLIVKITIGSYVYFHLLSYQWEWTFEIMYSAPLYSKPSLWEKFIIISVLVNSLLTSL
jgi:hypothetical protein